jgi:hypothetical protein
VLPEDCCSVRHYRDRKLSVSLCVFVRAALLGPHGMTARLAQDHTRRQRFHAARRLKAQATSQRPTAAAPAVVQMGRRRNRQRRRSSIGRSEDFDRARTAWSRANGSMTDIDGTSDWNGRVGTRTMYVRFKHGCTSLYSASWLIIVAKVNL